MNTETMTATPDARSLLPLRPAEFQILLLLANQDLHGYALLKEAERQSAGEVVLEVGSLYRVLKRLLEQELVAEAPDDDATAAPGKPRRRYRITAFGRQVARAEAERLEQAVAAARAARLLRPRGRA
jgi:DNA-binding PadR family transcriptional regulator